VQEIYAAVCKFARVKTALWMFCHAQHDRWPVGVSGVASFELCCRHSPVRLPESGQYRTFCAMGIARGHHQIATVLQQPAGYFSCNARALAYTRKV